METQERCERPMLIGICTKTTIVFSSGEAHKRFAERAKTIQSLLTVSHTAVSLAERVTVTLRDSRSDSDHVISLGQTAQGAL